MTQLIMWGVMPAEQAKPRRGAGRFASGFVVADDPRDVGFALESPTVRPVGAEARERESARLREIEARKAVKI
jgi:hypothetical protein